MATFEQHCAEAEQTFGKPYAEVHLWLDEFVGQAPHGMRHRKKRHHLSQASKRSASYGVPRPPQSHANTSSPI